jgi:putative DNA primase/helicase
MTAELHRYGNGETSTTRVVVSRAKVEGAVKAIKAAGRADRWNVWQREFKRLRDATLMTQEAAARLLQVAQETSIWEDHYGRQVHSMLAPFLCETEGDDDVVHDTSIAPAKPRLVEPEPRIVADVVVEAAAPTKARSTPQLVELGPYAFHAVMREIDRGEARIVLDGGHIEAQSASATDDGSEASLRRETKKVTHDNRKARSARRNDFDDVGRVIDLFSAAMRQAGLHPPPKIIADRHIHRFSTNGEKRDTAGFYVLYLDNIPAGMFGDFRSGIRQTWSARNDIELPPERRAELEELARRAKVEREVELQSRHAKGATEAKRIWDAAKEAPADHPYLVRKKIKPHGVRIAPHQYWPDVTCLIIPVMDGSNMISLHYIPPDEGQKKLYLEGARGKGGYCILGEVKNRLFLATGFATAATVRDETGEPVAVLFGDDNIMPAAKALRAHYPDVEFTICADDDWMNEGNPAVKKATVAARATGSKLAIPTFIEELRQPRHSDFNDMRLMFGGDGGDKVRERLAAAEFCVGPWEGPPELDPSKKKRESIKRTLIGANRMVPHQILTL